MREDVCVFLFALLGVSLAYGELDDSESRVVQITQGAVRGYKSKNNNYFAFHGIPYATAPTGPHRFKSPLPPPVWFNTFEAKNDFIICPQSPLLFAMIPPNEKSKNVTETENCLVANVFVPDTKETNLPVVVYVHGGAYQIGYGNLLKHDPLLKSGKLIEVTFNYRLGAHGFLCLGTEDIPGNAGMKDQVAALRWVKQNIANFGGNPEDVTIAGYSAGSSAVELLMLSGSASGLFNKVIPESGAATAVWSTQVDPLNSAKEFAKSQKFEQFDDVYALEEFYKTISLRQLQGDAFFERPDSTFVFVPCVERVKNKESFLTEVPMDILKRGQYNKVPMLVGFSNMEGKFRLPLLEKWKDKMNSNFEDFLPADLGFRDTEEKKEVAKKIKEFYFGNKPIDNDTAVDYVNYFSDVVFAYAIVKSAKLHVQAGSQSVYLYEYSYVDENHPTLYNVHGADHCAQSMGVAENIFPGPNIIISDEYTKVKENMAKLWTNFITTGKPVVSEMQDFPTGWPALSLKDVIYAELNVKPELRKDLLKERMEFWDGIYANYYREPIPPPEPIKSKIEL